MAQIRHLSWLREQRQDDSHFLSYFYHKSPGDAGSYSQLIPRQESLLSQLGMIKPLSCHKTKLKQEGSRDGFHHALSPRALRKMKAQQIWQGDAIHCCFDGDQVRAYWVELRESDLCCKL